MQDYLHPVRRWVRVEGTKDKQPITEPKPPRHWWFKNEVGKLVLSLRPG